MQHCFCTEAVLWGILKLRMKSMVHLFLFMSWLSYVLPVKRSLTNSIQTGFHVLATRLTITVINSLAIAERRFYVIALKVTKDRGELGSDTLFIRLLFLSVWSLSKFCRIDIGAFGLLPWNELNRMPCRFSFLRHIFLRVKLTLSMTISHLYKTNTVNINSDVQ